MHTPKDLSVTHDFFTAEEIEQFCEQQSLCTDATLEEAAVTHSLSTEGGVYDATARKTLTRSVEITPASPFLTKLLFLVIRQNNIKFKFKIDNFLSEQCVFFKYSRVGDHFTLHNDDDTTGRRKLSIIVLLSDPTDYEGARLVFYGNNKKERRFRVDMRKGSIIMFPSDVYHEVEPLVSGVRMSLVMWVG